MLDFRLMSGASVLLTVWRGSTIDNVKTVIQDNLGIPSAQQRLIFQDREMQSGYSVWEFELEHLDIVNIVVLAP